MKMSIKSSTFLLVHISKSVQCHHRADFGPRAKLPLASSICSSQILILHETPRAFILGAEKLKNSLC